MARNRLRIPCSFEIFGFTIKIVWDDNLLEGDDECYGMSDGDTCLITLRPPSSDYDNSQVEETYLHEAVHLILEYGGYNKESKNEKLVELIANLLHQMFVTAKYCELNDRMMDFVPIKVEKSKQK